MNKGNALAYNVFGGHYREGSYGIPQDWNKANELYLKAGELGCGAAYYNLGIAYDLGNGVEVDYKKAMHYYELAAMDGFVSARYNLGASEMEAGNYDRAFKHYMIAARAGDKEALERVKEGFIGGLVTKDEYASTLRAYHERQKEMKSEMRDKAMASGMFSSGE